jgi:hypothetical protein
MCLLILISLSCPFCPWWLQVQREGELCNSLAEARTSVEMFKHNNTMLREQLKGAQAPEPTTEAGASADRAPMELERQQALKEVEHLKTRYRNLLRSRFVDEPSPMQTWRPRRDALGNVFPSLGAARRGFLMSKYPLPSQILLRQRRERRGFFATAMARSNTRMLFVPGKMLNLTVRFLERSVPCAIHFQRLSPSFSTSAVSFLFQTVSYTVLVL